jgi:YesN/AraC family two-component response regulator
MKIRPFQGESMNKLSVVIVDDSKIALAQLESIINETESVDLVGSASDGLSAIRTVAQARPDLLLMDIVMPEMDGLSALRIIRSNHPDLKVAMISSLGGSGNHAEEAFRLGAIQVIGKPFERDQLDALFESLCSSQDSKGE